MVKLFAVYMVNHYDSAGKAINLYGSSSQFPQMSKEAFIKILDQSNYHEITDAELHGRSLDFTLQVNGEAYKGHALISQRYIDLDRLFRKAQLTDFKELSISKKKNTLPFHFKVNPAESKKINSILEEVLRIINSDGDVLEGSSNQPPKRPSPSSDHESRETKRTKARSLLISLSA